jgi:hypothetical protein
MCPVVHDTTMQPNLKLPAERRVSFLMGADTVVASVSVGRVRQVVLAGGAFGTADSVGIGTTLRRLLMLPDVKGYGAGGRLLVMSPAKCGLAFFVAGRYDSLPDGEKGIATLGQLPQGALVDGIRIDGCYRDTDDDEQVADDSTYDVQTDSLALARDLDGNGVTDYVVRETRPYRRGRMLYTRVAVYLDSIPASRRPRWSSGWDMEGRADFGEVDALGARGSLLVVLGNDADYTSETLLAIRDGTIAEEITHGEDYGRGFLDVTKERGTLVVDASQDHLTLRGVPAGPELACPGDSWAAVRARWDDAARRFVPEKPRCVKPKWPGGETSP